MNETKLLLKDRRAPDMFQDKPVTQQQWYALAVRQLSVDRSLRVIIPVLDEPFLHQHFQSTYVPPDHFFVVQVPGSPPEYIGIAGIAPCGALEVLSPVFASIHAGEDLPELLAQVYDKLFHLVTDQLGRDGAVARVIERSTHEKALEMAGYTKTAVLPDWHKDMRKTCNISLYTRRV